MNKTPQQLLSDIADAYIGWVGAPAAVLAEPILREERFWTWPGSANGKHHGYEGGLAQHTLEVLQLCRSMAESPVYAGKIDVLTLATGALWHDIGKVDSYVRRVPESPPGNASAWGKSQSEQLGVPHIASGLMRWGYVVRKPLTQGQHTQVAHLIASHHGRLEWGSPVLPKDAAALMLHQADMLSVMADCGLNPQRR